MLVTHERNGVAQPAILRGMDLVDIVEVRSVLELICLGDEASGIVAAAHERPASRHVDDAHLLAPIPEPERFIMAVGLNYRAHFEEGLGKRGDRIEEPPEYPAFFAKADTCVAGPRESIPYDPRLTTKLDYEAEIAVVIGIGGRSIPPEAAGDHVFGYMLANDVTARDIQRRHGGQWLKGKSIDRSCPMGPWLVTPDELSEDELLDLRCEVNGVRVQEATTDLMMFSFADLVAALSEAMTLLPGDILLTGTPAGVGYARTPPRFLVPGDEVVVASSRLGFLRNRVAERSLTSYVSHAPAHHPAR